MSEIGPADRRRRDGQRIARETDFGSSQRALVGTARSRRQWLQNQNDGGILGESTMARNAGDEGLTTAAHQTSTTAASSRSLNGTVDPVNGHSGIALEWQQLEAIRRISAAAALKFRHVAVTIFVGAAFSSARRFVAACHQSFLGLAMFWLSVACEF